MTCVKCNKELEELAPYFKTDEGIVCYDCKRGKADQESEWNQTDADHDAWVAEQQAPKPNRK